jgi:hypothetical protein
VYLIGDPNPNPNLTLTLMRLKFAMAGGYPSVRSFESCLSKEVLVPLQELPIVGLLIVILTVKP